MLALLLIMSIISFVILVKMIQMWIRYKITHGLYILFTVLIGLLFVACAYGTVFLIGGNSPHTRSYSSYSSYTNTCSSCGRSFSAGDSDGNYKNIASTGMCNNCYKNFKTQKSWGY